MYLFLTITSILVDYNEVSMDKRQRIAIWIMCGLSLVLSIVAVCVACFRTGSLSFDYQGVIVGVLSLLVTVLIGWNIYNLIDINNTRKAVKDLLSDTSLKLNKNMAITEHSFWMLYHYLLIGKDPIGLDYRFVHHGIACLFHASNFNDIGLCNTIVKAMLECIKDPQNIKFTKNNKAEILKLMTMIKNVDKIEGYLELIKRVSNIGLK